VGGGQREGDGGGERVCGARRCDLKEDCGKSDRGVQRRAPDQRPDRPTETRGGGSSVPKKCGREEERIIVDRRAKRGFVHVRVRMLAGVVVGRNAKGEGVRGTTYASRHRYPMQAPNTGGIAHASSAAYHFESLLIPSTGPKCPLCGRPLPPLVTWHGATD
jgi:hypothetical protein